MSARVIIVGSGPAGVMTALSCREANAECEIRIIDKEKSPLSVFLKKNRARWSLTRELYDPAELAAQYMRGEREMLGPLHRFGAADTVAFFEDRAIELVVADYVSPSRGMDALRSCMLSWLEESRVKTMLDTNVFAADAKSTGGFWLTLENGETLECEKLVLACGGMLSTKARAICNAFGHTVVDCSPSIFDLHTKDKRITRASGTVHEGVRLTDDSGAEALGTVRLEPWGLSGAAVGELTSRAAESMRDRHYQFELRIDWLGGHEDASRRGVDYLQRNEPGRQVADESCSPIQPRFWRQMVVDAHIDPGTTWGRLTKPETRALHRQLRHDTVKIVKRGAHDQETAVCGGLALNEVDFRDFQSRVVPGLHFAGGILDIDGLPGGANLQAGWTSGYLAGQGVAEVSTM